jgi:hypothetical protein
MPQTFLLFAGLWLAITGIHAPSLALAFECGDMDRNGTVAATDALMVLRAAVDLEPALECPCEDCVPGTTTTTLGVVVDECFDDDDCELDFPGLPICLSGICVECIGRVDCPAEHECIDTECIPKICLGD